MSNIYSYVEGIHTKVSGFGEKLDNTWAYLYDTWAYVYGTYNFVSGFGDRMTSTENALSQKIGGKSCLWRKSWFCHNKSYVILNNPLSFCDWKLPRTNWKHPLINFLPASRARLQVSIHLTILLMSLLVLNPALLRPKVILPRRLKVSVVRSSIILQPQQIMCNLL